MIVRVQLLFLLVLTGLPAAAKPLIKVRGRDIAVDVAIRKGFIHVKFGFRVRGSVQKLWKIVRSFKGYPKYVDGLEPVKVRKKGGAYHLVLSGSLIWQYYAKVVAKPRFRKGHGEVAWNVVGAGSSSKGLMRVDPAGRGAAVFTLATKVKKEIDLPDFLIETGLRVAIRAVGKAVREAIETKG